jgi:hypothetical protein
VQHLDIDSGRNQPPSTSSGRLDKFSNARVEQIHLETGKAIKTHNTPLAAVHSMGVSSHQGNLFRVLRGKKSHWRGFGWRWKVGDDTGAGKGNVDSDSDSENEPEEKMFEDDEDYLNDDDAHEGAASSSYDGFVEQERTQT